MRIILGKVIETQSRNNDNKSPTLQEIRAIFASSDEDEDKLALDESVIESGQSVTECFETTLHAGSIGGLLTTLKKESEEET